MRKHAIVQITEGNAETNRDFAKRFFLTEMPAAQAEAWGFRALGICSRNDLSIDATVMGMGMAGMTFVGLKALMAGPFDEVKPLLDEMFECVKRIEDKLPEGRPLVETDIEEVTTRVLLRDEVLKLHVNFSILENLSTGMAQLRAVLSIVDSSITPTSASALQ